MSMMKHVQIAVAAALLIAVAAPVFAESTRCMNKVGLCDKGEERSQPERAAVRGGDAPAGDQGEPDTGNTDTGEPDTSEPAVE
jgi:hypothetical protein